jgi:hypothetical protein
MPSPIVSPTREPPQFHWPDEGENTEKSSNIKILPCYESVSYPESLERLLAGFSSLHTLFWDYGRSSLRIPHLWDANEFVKAIARTHGHSLRRLGLFLSLVNDPWEEPVEVTEPARSFKQFEQLTYLSIDARIIEDDTRTPDPAFINRPPLGNAYYWFISHELPPLVHMLPSSIEHVEIFLTDARYTIWQSLLRDLDYYRSSCLPELRKLVIRYPKGSDIQCNGNRGAPHKFLPTLVGNIEVRVQEIDMTQFDPQRVPNPFTGILPTRLCSERVINERK